MSPIPKPVKSCLNPCSQAACVFKSQRAHRAGSAQRGLPPALTPAQPHPPGGLFHRCEPATQAGPRPEPGFHFGAWCFRSRYRPRHNPISTTWSWSPAHCPWEHRSTAPGKAPCGWGAPALSPGSAFPPGGGQEPLTRRFHGHSPQNPGDPAPGSPPAAPSGSEPWVGVRVSAR